jgi:hypothetical protein
VAMILVTPPELSVRALDMAPDLVVRDDGTHPVPAKPTSALGGRLWLCGPVAAPVSATFVEEDSALQAFVEAESGVSVYYLVHLAITAVWEPNQPRFERLSVALRLVSPNSVAVVWSMAPTRVTDPSQLETSFRLGPQVKLFGFEADVGSVNRGRTSSKSQIFLEALGELCSELAWEFHRTRDMEIRGSHRLALVVRAPAGVETRLEGSVSATVVSGSRPWREHADMSELLTLSARL